MATLPSSTHAAEELHYNPDRMECRKGILTQKTVGGVRHHDCQLAMTNILRRLIKTSGYKATQEWSVVYGTDWYVPDIAVASPGYSVDHRDYLIGPAYLCVEIVSKAQRLSKLFNRCEDCHSGGTKFCWVIDLEESTFYEYHAGSAIVPVKQELATDQFSMSIADLLAEIEQQA